MERYRGKRTPEELRAWVESKGYTRDAYKRAILEGIEKAEWTTLDNGRVSVHSIERSQRQSLEEFVGLCGSLCKGSVVVLHGPERVLGFIQPDGSLVSVFERRVI